MQVVAPVDPGVPAFASLETTSNLCFLSISTVAREVPMRKSFFPIPTQNSFRSYFRSGIVEGRLVLFFQFRAGGHAAPAAGDAENARTEHAEIGKFVQMRDADVERLCPTHREPGYRPMRAVGIDAIVRSQPAASNL